MLYFRMPPGTSLGAWPGAGLQPHPHLNSFLQPHPRPNSFLQPHPNPHSFLQPHIRARSALPPVGMDEPAPDEAIARQQALIENFGWPWFGVDDGWWQSSPAAMQAYALQKVRTRILRPQDPRVTAARKRGTTRTAVPLVPSGASAAAAADPLWRWQPSYRVMAVVAELSSHLRAQGGNVVWLGEPVNDQVPVWRVLSLEPPGKGFDYAIQIDKVLRAAVERQDRLPEILSQSDEIGPFFDAIVGVDRSVAPRLAELLEAAWELATLVVMALKNEVAELRPFQRNDAVLPVIPTPGHGSLPSGHATMATLAAELLIALRFGQDAERCTQLDQLARRIAFNRVVAGVHFPMDSFAGYGLGRQLAAVLVAAARGSALPEQTTLTVQEHSTLEEAGERPGNVPLSKGNAIDQLPCWSLLWAAAEAELELRRV